MKAPSMDQLMMHLKDFPASAEDSASFMKVCFDVMWIGSFKMSRIEELRLHHFNIIVPVRIPCSLLSVIQSEIWKCVFLISFV